MRHRQFWHLQHERQLKLPAGKIRSQTYPQFLWELLYSLHPTCNTFDYLSFLCISVKQNITAAACCASFNTVEVWSARRKSRAVHDTVAHFSHIFNKTTFDLMFYEGEEENQDLNKCCICCSWSGKHKLSLLCSAAVTTSTFACFVHSLPLELLHVWKLWRLVHHGHDGNRCDFMCLLVHTDVWEL